MTVAKHYTHKQLHYFDTTSFEPPDENNNMLLYTNNVIITIPDDDCEPISTSNTSNTKDNTTAVSDENEFVLVSPPVKSEHTDDEYAIVSPPD